MNADNPLFSLLVALNQAVEQLPPLEDSQRESLRAIINDVAAHGHVFDTLRKDPEAVLVNLMRGTLARPSLRSMLTLYGEVLNGDEAQLAEIARLRLEVDRLKTLIETVRSPAVSISQPESDDSLGPLAVNAYIKPSSANHYGLGSEHDIRESCGDSWGLINRLLTMLNKVPTGMLVKLQDVKGRIDAYRLLAYDLTRGIQDRDALIAELRHQLGLKDKPSAQSQDNGMNRHRPEDYLMLNRQGQPCPVSELAPDELAQSLCECIDVIESLEQTSIKQRQILEKWRNGSEQGE